jgi:type VI secretion system secreted protein VgrG
MNLDIRAGVIAATILTVIFFLISVITGAQTVLASRKIKFFNLSQDQKRRGWRLVILGLFFAILSVLVYFYGEPVAYTVITPSPTKPSTQTPTISPSASVSPTITQTPTITLTPAESYTPQPTSTPHIPVAVEARFEGKLTPPAEAAFSPLVFSNIGLDDDYNPIGPGIQFTNPVGHLFAVFSYALLEDDIQWSALWYRGDELVHYESLPWNGGSGGIGYTDWDPAAEMWLPGAYEVQIFLGLDFYISGQFTVVGEPPTPTVTPTPIITLSPTTTIQSTVTVSPTP